MLEELLDNSLFQDNNATSIQNNNIYIFHPLFKNKMIGRKQEGNEFRELCEGVRRESTVFDRNLLRGSDSGLDQRILEAESAAQPNLLLAINPRNRYNEDFMKSLTHALQSHYTQEQIAASFAESLDDATRIAENPGFFVICDDENVARGALAQGNSVIYIDDTSEITKEALRKERKTRTIGKYHFGVYSDDLGTKLTTSVDEIIAQYQSTEPDKDGHPEVEQLKVLILDDEGVDSGLMMLYQQELESLGYEVIITDSEDDFMHVIKEGRVHLAILDYHYDPKDPEGKESNGLLLSVRTRAYCPDLPVILNTARKELIPELEEKAPKYLVDAVVLKSADLDPLKGEVQKLMVAYHGKIDVDIKAIKDSKVPEIQAK